MAIAVRTATSSDIDAVVELQIGLFDADAGVHDPTTDLEWPRREGRADISDLLDNDSATVLVAVIDGETVGFLAGYTTPPSDIRPITSGVLRSLFVDEHARRSGAARALVTTFVDWSRERGCQRVVVDHYAANHGAATLYASLGFEELSVTRVLSLQAP